MAVYTMLGFDSVLTKCASVGYFDKILFETFILNYFCVFFMFFFQVPVPAVRTSGIRWN